MNRNPRLNNIWRDMRDRCNNSNRRDYKWYGAKGIKVCREWENDFRRFEKWAMDNGYSDNLTLERIDNALGYCPSNCKWIPFKQQRENTTQTLKVTIAGETKPLKHWCEQLGKNYNTVYMRYKRGKTIMEALNGD